MTFTVDPEHSYIGQFVKALVFKVSLQLTHFFLYALASIGIADIISFDIRLSKQRIIDAELWIEAHRPFRRQEGAVCLIVYCADIVCHKPAEPGDYDTIIVQKQYFYMST